MSAYIYSQDHIILQCNHFFLGDFFSNRRRKCEIHRTPFNFSPGTLIKMSNVMTFEVYPYLTAATALSYCIREFFILLPKQSVSLPLEDAAKVSLIASNSKFEILP